MAATPRFKVFDRAGTYQASTHEVEAAAALLASIYEGGTIRLGHSRRDIVWEDGKDGNAVESYDAVAITVYARLDELRAAMEAKYGVKEKLHAAFQALKQP
jgi:hypothetical protein